VAVVPDDRRVLDGIDRLVIDGTNVLHALSRSAIPVPTAALVGRLRAVVPPGVAIVVVLDGSPEHGLVARRVASGVEVRYAGRATADEAITALVERERGGFGTVGLLVVTDDIELARHVRRAGGRTVRNGWLIGRLGRQRLSAPVSGKTIPGSIGRPAPAAGASRAGQPEPHSEDDDSGAPRWSPGRGATRKRGNPRRGH
jgi:hypothetical protein